MHEDDDLLNRPALILLLLAFSQLIPPVLADPQALSFVQRSRLAGKQEIFISGDSIKIVNKAASRTLIATGPKFGISVWSEQSKSYYKTDLRHFIGFFGSSLLFEVGEYMSDLPLPFVSRRTIKILGIECRHRYMQGRKVQTRRKAQAGELTMSGPTEYVTRADYYTAISPHISDNITALLCRIYKVPKLDGFPVRLIYTNNDTDANIAELDTLSASTIPLKKDFFAVPKGYAEVKSDADLYKNENTSVDIEEMIKVMPEHLQKRQ